MLIFLGLIAFIPLGILCKVLHIPTLRTFLGLVLLVMVWFLSLITRSDAPYIVVMYGLAVFGIIHALAVVMHRSITFIKKDIKTVYGDIFMALPISVTWVGKVGNEYSQGEIGGFEVFMKVLPLLLLLASYVFTVIRLSLKRTARKAKVAAAGGYVAKKVVDKVTYDNSIEGIQERTAKVEARSELADAKTRARLSSVARAVGSGVVIGNMVNQLEGISQEDRAKLEAGELDTSELRQLASSLKGNQSTPQLPG